MNTLLLFFAFPVATIILAIVLQKILNNPLLVAATFFAIYLIVAFAAFDASFLVYAIAYTILAYITATLTRLICRLLQMLANQNNNSCTYRVTERPITISTNLSSDGNDLTSNTTLLTNSASANNYNGGNCGCNCRRR